MLIWIIVCIVMGLVLAVSLSLLLHGQKKTKPISPSPPTNPKPTSPPLPAHPPNPPTNSASFTTTASLWICAPDQISGKGINEKCAQVPAQTPITLTFIRPANSWKISLTLSEIAYILPVGALGPFHLKLVPQLSIPTEFLPAEGSNLFLPTMETIRQIMMNLVGPIFNSPIAIYSNDDPAYFVINDKGGIYVRPNSEQAFGIHTKDNSYVYDFFAGAKSFLFKAQTIQWISGLAYDE